MDFDQFPITRAGALERLDAFVAEAALDYGKRRNLVDVAGAHSAVSRLSAALRRRLVSEEEVLRAVLAAHPLGAVEQFVAEVFWRTYWKGWLELHRGLWGQFGLETEEERARLSAEPKAAAYERAVSGTTGIEAYDHWAAELTRTGYLHNWARMQVASIWTFTLGLPWQLGADWMFARLRDADPASNTLSWRWVAGLHTAGKAYVADEARISAMTGGALAAKGLASVATIPAQDAPPVRTELREPVLPDRAAPSLVLLTCEDLSLETVAQLDEVRAVAVVGALAASQADKTALADAAGRSARHWQAKSCEVAQLGDLVAAARESGCTQIVTGFVPVGPTADVLEPVRPILAGYGIALTEYQRTWDRLAWPYCGKGFFQLRSRIPALLREQGITG